MPRLSFFLANCYAPFFCSHLLLSRVFCVSSHFLLSPLLRATSEKEHTVDAVFFFSWKADRWPLMDAKLGYRWGVVSVLTSMHPAWQSVQWQHHQNHSVWEGTGAERRWCRTTRARFKQCKSVLGSRVLTLQSIDSSFFFFFIPLPFSLSSSHSLLSRSLSAVYDKWVQNTIWLHPSMCASPINDVYFLLGLPITTILLLFTLNLLPLLTSSVMHNIQEPTFLMEPDLARVTHAFNCAQSFPNKNLCNTCCVINLNLQPYSKTMWEVVYLCFMKVSRGVIKTACFRHSPDISDYSHTILFIALKLASRPVTLL